jgi:hypothetical protein
VEIKFHSNENVEWHCIHFESNWIYSLLIQITLYWIKIWLNRNGVQIGVKDVEILFVTIVEKKTLKIHKSKKYYSNPLYLGIG